MAIGARDPQAKGEGSAWTDVCVTLSSMRLTVYGATALAVSALGCDVGLPDRLPDVPSQLPLIGPTGAAANTPTTCEPTFEPYPEEKWNPIHQQRVCDDATLRTALTCALNPLQASSPECTALSAAKDPCLSCVATSTLSGRQGPLMDWGDGTFSPNVPGCVAIISGDVSSRSCGSRLLARNFCEYSYCGHCNDDATWLACVDKAQATVCSQHVAVTRECERYLEPCGDSLPTANEAYVAVGRVFCGR